MRSPVTDTMEMVIDAVKNIGNVCGTSLKKKLLCTLIRVVPAVPARLAVQQIAIVMKWKSVRIPSAVKVKTQTKKTRLMKAALVATFPLSA